MSELTKAPIKRIITKNGSIKISEQALNMIIDNVENYLEDMSNKLILNVREDNRKTILDKDVNSIL